MTQRIIRTIFRILKGNPKRPIRKIQANSIGRKQYLTHKEMSRKYIRERVNELNKNYGHDFGKISIRDQKTRWGSCSKKKNLNFNYRILFLPEALSDLVIVHELCHLREFNHSQSFWKLVERTIPDYLLRRRELSRISPHSLLPKTQRIKAS